MLETVKSYILDLDDITFEQYLDQYAMYVQDSNISSEVTFNAKNLNILDIERLTQDQHERLVST
nr:MAG TPA: hypothetical protein [Caudoviricetes sp.]